MTFQPNQNLYGVAIGSTNGNDPGYPHYDVRAPSTSDYLYPIGKQWIYVGQSIWELLNITTAGGLPSANWVQLADSDGPVQAIVGTANQVTASNSAGTVTLSTPATFIAPGSIASTTSITSATTLTATLGNITATNGNLVLGTAGNKIVSTSVGSGTAAGANSFGTTTLTNGTATVSTTAVTSSSIIMLTRQSIGTTGAAALGMISVGTIVNGTSFVINALTTANANTVVAADQSIVGWMIIN